MDITEAAELYPIAWRWPGPNDDIHGWQPVSENGSGAASELEVIPLAAQINRTLWGGEAGGGFAVCRSNDGILGTVLEAEAATALRVPGEVGEKRRCVECPAASRKGPEACKSQQIIWALTRQHHSSPIRIRLPHYAARGWRVFLRQHTREVLGTTVLSLSASDWDTQFPKVTVSIVRNLDDAGLQLVDEVLNNHVFGMLALGVNFEEETSDTANDSNSPQADILFGPEPSSAAPKNSAADEQHGE